MAAAWMWTLADGTIPDDARARVSDGMRDATRAYRRWMAAMYGEVAHTVLVRSPSSDALRTLSARIEVPGDSGAMLVGPEPDGGWGLPSDGGGTRARLWVRRSGPRDDDGDGWFEPARDEQLVHGWIPGAAERQLPMLADIRAALYGEPDPVTVALAAIATRSPSLTAGALAEVAGDRLAEVGDRLTRWAIRRRGLTGADVVAAVWQEALGGSGSGGGDLPLSAFADWPGAAGWVPVILPGGVTGRWVR